MNRYPLSAAKPADHGIRPEPIERLASLIERHIAEGRYPGAQIALARHGRLLIERSFGQARTTPAPMPAANDTLWLLYSNTKVILATALWKLADLIGVQKTIDALKRYDLAVPALLDAAARGDVPTPLFNLPFVTPGRYLAG